MSYSRGGTVTTAVFWNATPWILIDGSVGAVLSVASERKELLVPTVRSNAAAFVTAYESGTGEGNLCNSKQVDCMKPCGYYTYHQI